MRERTGVKWILHDSEETCLFKVKCWSSVTPSVLMVSENGMGMPAIVGDATGGKVRRCWRVVNHNNVAFLVEKILIKNSVCG